MDDGSAGARTQAPGDTLPPGGRPVDTAAVARALLADADLVAAADPDTLLPMAQQLVEQRTLDDDADFIARCYEIACRSSPEVFGQASAATRRWLIDLHAARQGSKARPTPADPWQIAWTAGFQANRGFQTAWLNTTGEAATIATGVWNGGPVAAISYDDGTVRVWDLGAGLPIGKPTLFPERIGHDYTAIAIGSAHGRLVVATVGFDGGSLWDVLTGRQERCLPKRLNAVTFGKAGQRTVAVMGGEGAVHVWDLHRRKPIHGLRLTGHSGPVYAVAVATLGDTPAAVSTGEDGTVRVWDLRTGAPIGTPMTGPPDELAVLAVTRVQRRPVAVTAGAEGPIRLWDLHTKQPVGQPLAGHTGRVWALHIIHQRGRPTAVTAGQDGTVRCWDLATRRQSGPPLIPDGKPIWALAATEARGRPVALASTRHTAEVGLWDLDTGARSTWTPAGKVPVVALAAGPGRDGPVVLTVPDCPRSPGRQVRDAATGRDSAPFAIRMQPDRTIRAAAIGSLDGDPVAITGDSAGSLRLWGVDGAGRQPRPEPLTGHDGQILDVVLCQHGPDEFAVSTGEDGTVRVWDLRRHTERAVLVGHAGPVTSAAVSAGRDPVVVSGSEDGTVRRWNLSGAALSRPLTADAGPVRAVAVGILDGRLVIASAADDGMVRLWDLHTGKQFGHPSGGHDGPASAVTFIRQDDSAIVVSGGHDGSLRVWTAKAAGQATAVFPWPIGALRWSATGHLIVAFGSETAALRPQLAHLQREPLPRRRAEQALAVRMRPAPFAGEGGRGGDGAPTHRRIR